MPEVVLGVDGGATASSAVVLTDSGDVLAQASVGSTNQNSVGKDRARTKLLDLVQQVLDRAGINRVDCAVFGVAGINNPTQERELEQWLKPHGFARRLQVENDSVAAWAAATGGAPGVVVISGTGSIAFGVDRHGERKRVGGWGYAFGDEGSGYRIVTEALRAAVQYHDGRGPATGLLLALVEEFEVESVDGLTRAVYAEGMDTGRIAAALPAVVKTAREGDAVAQDIFRTAGEELGHQTLAVIRALDFAPNGQSFPVGLSGGVFRSGDLLVPHLAGLLDRCAPAAELQRVRFEPVFGAALLALRIVGRAVSPGELDDFLCRACEQQELGPHDAGQENSGENPAPALHRMNTRKLLEFINEQDWSVAPAVAMQLSSIERAVKRVSAALRNGGRVLYVGAGTSGRLGILDAVECPPTFGYEPERFGAVLAGGKRAFVEAVEGAEDDRAAGAAAVRDQGIGSTDVVVGLSASGTTPYTLGAVEAAEQKGAVTIGITTAWGSELASSVTVPIVVPVGEEVVLGSTRMKAGTAQKLVLNMISTAVSVKLGKVYGRLMVDVQPTNRKLKARAAEIVSILADCTHKTAERTLEACGYSVKEAIVCAACDVGPGRAQELLAQAAGRLESILDKGLDANG